MPNVSPRQSAKGLFPVVKTTHPDAQEHRREMANAINTLRRGKMNVVGSVTLTANAASTTIMDALIGKDTVIIMVPTTANAAGAVATTYQTLPNVTNQQAVINHANNAQTDRTFAYAAIG